MSYDPAFTAQKAAETLPANVLNATGKNPESSGTNLNPYGITSYIDARRKGRSQHSQLAPELETVLEAKKRKVHIWNVGPFPHTVPTGSTGVFFIPACPEDKPYIEMQTPLYEVVDEIYPKTKNADAKRLYDEGRRFAIDILGEGKNQNKKQSLRRVGVFISKGDVPTKKEVDDAKAECYVYCSEQVAVMDATWDRDRKLAYDMYRAESFGACARFLGLSGKEKMWLAQGAPTTQTKCPFCGEAVEPTAPKCRNCHEIINPQAYSDLKAKMAGK